MLIVMDVMDLIFCLDLFLIVFICDIKGLGKFNNWELLR